jgi:hypothetical protein
MTKRRSWFRQRTLPDRSAVESTGESYLLLKFFHPASASAMALGGAGGGYLGWTLFRGAGTFVGVCAAGLGGCIGAVLAYWLVRLILAFND